MSQSARLIKHIRAAGKRGMSYLELELLRISSSPWKRLSESGERHLKCGERLVRKEGRDGLVRFHVVRA